MVCIKARVICVASDNMKGGVKERGSEGWGADSKRNPDRALID
jgi:hypothetical protein